MPSTSSFELVRDVLRAEFEIPPEKVRPGARLADDLDLDSLDRVHLSHALEDREIRVSDDDLAQAGTIDQLVALVDEGAPPTRRDTA